MPDFRIIALDESEHWPMMAADLPEVSCLYGLYLVDFNCETYACSLTPDYWARWLETVWTSKPALVIAENRREHIHHYIDRGNARVDSDGYFGAYFLRHYATTHAELVTEAPVAGTLLKQYRSGALPYDVLFTSVWETLREKSIHPKGLLV